MLSFAPAAARATSWDVVFTGSGSSTASYHADEWDTIDTDGQPKCESNSWDYSESATFRWSYRWSHVHLDGRREILDPSRHQGSGSETVHYLFGKCRGDDGGPYDCDYGLRPDFDGSFLFSQLIRGRRRFQARAFMSVGSHHCTGPAGYDKTGGPQPNGAVYNGFITVDRTLSAADVAGTHTVTKHVTLTQKVLGAPLHGACSGKQCQLAHCSTKTTLAYDQQCSYTVGWKGVVKLIPRR